MTKAETRQGKMAFTLPRNLLLLVVILAMVTFESNLQNESIISAVVSGLLQENNMLKERLSYIEITVNKLLSRVTETDKKKRLLMSSSGNAVPSGEYPAFYTLLTHQETNISPHHTIVFDMVRTDTHKAYSNYTGAYTVPVAGVYVISWSVRSSGGHSFELVCNSQVLDSGFNDSDSQKTIGKTYLGHFKVKDVIFVRTNNSYVGSGNILSNTHGYSTFLGYRIIQ